MCRAGADPDLAPLADYVHDLAARGMGVKTIASSASPKFVAAGQKPLSARGVHRHLRQHWELRRREVGGDEVDALVNVSPISPERAGGLDDYDELVEIVGKLMRKVEALERDPDAFTGPDGRLDPYRLSPWTGLVNSARSAIQALHQMRQTDRVVNAMLVEQTSAFAQAFVIPVGEELRALMDLAERTCGGEEVAARIHDLVLGDGIATMAEQAGEASIAQTRTKYKLMAPPR